MNTRSVIGVGSAPNDNTGDPLRQAFQKANSNFSDLFPLEADLNLYASPTGNDANDGLSAGAPVTIQEAVSRAARVSANVLAYNSYKTVTVNLADGTYILSNPLFLPVGQTNTARGVLLGNSVAPSNVIIRNTGAVGTVLDCNGTWTINGAKLEYTGVTASAVLVRNQSNSDIILRNIVFGANVATGINVYVFGRAYCSIFEAVSDIGGGRTIAAFVQVEGGGFLVWASSSCACGTLTISGNFVQALNVSQIRTAGVTFTGTVTGSRYLVALNSVINTFGGGANYFPGNVAGTIATGGQYS